VGGRGGSGGQVSGETQDLRRTDFAEVVEGVDAGIVAVGPVDLEGVVSDEIRAGGDDAVGEIAGENREGGFDLLLRGVAFADLAALGAGAHRAEQLDWVHAEPGVGPADFQLFISLQIKGQRRYGRCHRIYSTRRDG